MRCVNPVNRSPEPLMTYIAAYAAAGAAFLILDMIWLGFAARGIYQAEIGPLLREPFNIPAATAFYLLYLFGVVFFAIAPALESGGLVRAALTGAVFGLVAYGTYDLTNLATLNGYTTRIAIIDMIWGAFLTAGAAAAGYLAAARFAV